MRRMSFNLTQQQVLDRTKTVTRRLGWTFAKPGDRYLAVDRLRSKDAKALAVIEVVCVYREPLIAIDYDDVEREGFGYGQLHGLPAADRVALRCTAIRKFVAMFCMAAKCAPTTTVTRIEFRYLGCIHCGGKGFDVSFGVVSECAAEVRS